MERSVHTISNRTAQSPSPGFLLPPAPTPTPILTPFKPRSSPAFRYKSIAFYKRVMRNGLEHIGTKQWNNNENSCPIVDEFASLPSIVPEGPIAIYGLHHPSGYAGIVIDLFSDGKVLSHLQEVEIWLKLRDRLMPNGRFMVNCGGVSESSIDGKVHHQSDDEIWIQNSTIKALAEAFPGQVNWKKLPESQGLNYLALTGPLPDLTSWSAMVPNSLSEAVKQWKPCRPFL
ncbi:S-adenosyl-L-methionine-dependent methyltransferases superfamily protein isoform 2 [Hibiscus syriacus]|uniref:S-adenosyl-L-methionine-dependent methyltransferases superfamily protein isoform 2 n=1 Tax=Hibiscus syriacus TaxID=106335 RepID=A0A6A3A3E0_HIBSY|nr:S-adenosyl-L-methionine-dependent methyltransferases superfamily protein isoform 2 [Hibiscus syriacus]